MPKFDQVPQMNFVRSYHWWITGTLFATALVLYATGLTTGAVATVFFGFIIETAAWISIALHPNNSGGDPGK